MPTFNITGPDGMKYRVTGENAEGALNALRKSFGEGESRQSQDLRSELSRMTQEPDTAAGEVARYDRLPEWQKPIVALSDLGQLTANGATFGFMDKAAAAVRSPFTGNSYADELEAQRAQTQAARDRSGLAGTVAEIGGGVGTGLGLANKGVTLAGRFGTAGMTGLPGFAARSGLSAAEGTGYGILNALGNDQDVMTGAGIGAGLGFLAPAASNVIGRGVGAVTNWASGPRGVSPAQRMFAEAAMADDVAGDVAGNIARFGDNGMPMDLGPNLQGLGEAMATVPGSGRTIVEKAVRVRDARANARINGALDDTFGKAQVPSQVASSIDESMAALGPAYDEAFVGAKPIDTRQIAGQLDSMSKRLRGGGQKAAQSIRKMLNVTGTDELDTNPSTLFEIWRAIDGMFETADSSAKNILTVIRQQVDKELKRAVPRLKSVDARFAELARQKEALGRGQQMLDSSRTAPRPSEVASEFRSGALPEGELIGPSGASVRLRQGTRAEIERIVGTTNNDRVALQRLIKGEGDWNRHRLVTLFGKPKAERIFDVLDREARFATTSNTVLGNSRTAAREAGKAKIQGDRSPGVFQEAGDLRFGRAAARMGDRLFGNMDDAAREVANSELARLLTGPAGTTRKIQMIQAARRRGDITAETMKKMVQSLVVTGSGGEPGNDVRRRIELTVGHSR